jgi:hypothetical protein
VLGEHGFIGLAIWLLLGLYAWRTGSKVIRLCKKDPEKKWAEDLAAMTQVSMVGYAAGGAFLGLAYLDLYYHLIIIMALTYQIAVKNFWGTATPSVVHSQVLTPTNGRDKQGRRLSA